MQASNDSKTESAKSPFELVLALYDKSPTLAWVVTIIAVTTPIILGWFSYLKKKEETKIQQFKYIVERRSLNKRNPK